MALANHRHDQVTGGKDRIALPLKAASVTTNAGKARKPRMAITVTLPTQRKSFCHGDGGISVRPNSLERISGHPHHRQHREGESEAGDRKACRERKIEAREAELIDEICDHVDLSAADQLRGRERAE